MAEPKDFPTIRAAARFVLLDLWEAVEDEKLADSLAESIERWSAEAVRKAQEAAWSKGYDDAVDQIDDPFEVDAPKWAKDNPEGALNPYRKEATP